MHRINRDALFARIRDRQLELVRSGWIGGAEIVVNQGGECVLHETFGTNGVNGPALVGSVIAPNAIWGIADLALGVMTVINLCVIIIMRKEVLTTEL